MTKKSSPNVGGKERENLGVWQVLKHSYWLLGGL